MHFSDYIVDAEVGKVSVRGVARFTWKSNGQSWNDMFTYVLSFDGEGKVVTCEIWADSGAAFLASRGWLGADGEVLV